MRFSKKSEYALRAMTELTQEFGHGLVQRKSLAERQNIPLGFLEMILLSLKNAGLIGSRRGAHGGVFLIKSPREVTLGQIIRLLDGPLAPIACVSQTAYQKCRDCPHAATKTCPIQRIMLDVRNAIASVLDHYTLEDFVFPQKGGALLNLKTPPVSGATQKKKKSSDSQF
ncbi:MAG TPA: Rrf2 family transcriptional regulator [Nitrospirales bacterium]|nr:Rrf2 family transcriptional regulator [Nitrospirales bacterium]